MAVDRLSMQFYSSLHPRGPHVQGIQFYLGNPGLEWGIAARHSVGSPFGLGALRSSATTRLAGLGAWFSAQPTRWLILAVAVYLATTLLSTILSVSFSVSMWGEVPGEDGYATYSIIAYVLLFAVIVTHLRRRAQAMRLLWAVAAMGVLVGVYFPAAGLRL